MEIKLCSLTVVRVFETKKEWGILKKCLKGKMKVQGYSKLLDMFLINMNELLFSLFFSVCYEDG
jgi:hypothetical protein